MRIWHRGVLIDQGALTSNGWSRVCHVDHRCRKSVAFVVSRAMRVNVLQWWHICFSHSCPQVLFWNASTCAGIFPDLQSCSAVAPFLISQARYTSARVEIDLLVPTRISAPKFPLVWSKWNYFHLRFRRRFLASILRVLVGCAFGNINNSFFGIEIEDGFRRRNQGRFSERIFFFKNPTRFILKNIETNNHLLSITSQGCCGQTWFSAYQKWSLW